MVELRQSSRAVVKRAERQFGDKEWVHHNAIVFELLPEESQVVDSEPAHLIEIRHRSLESGEASGGFSFNQRFERLSEEGCSLGDTGVLLGSLKQFVVE